MISADSASSGSLAFKKEAAGTIGAGLSHGPDEHLTLFNSGSHKHIRLVTSGGLVQIRSAIQQYEVLNPSSCSFMVENYGVTTFATHDASSSNYGWLQFAIEGHVRFRPVLSDDPGGGGPFFMVTSHGATDVFTVDTDSQVTSVAGVLRITQDSDSSKYAEFEVDANHDLTITPKSTGQIKLQPTTDSVDFFQVLDADGGTPILNVDATNEMVAIGSSDTAQPSDYKLSVHSDIANQAVTQIANHNSSGYGGQLELYRSFGTAGSPTSPTGGNVSLGRIYWQSIETLMSYSWTGAAIEAKVPSGQAIGLLAVPTNLLFSTSGVAAGLPFERMVITHDGKVGIGSGTPATLAHIPSGTLDVKGDGSTSQVFFLSGSGGMNSPDETTYPDMCFFVSGTVGKKDTTTKGVAVFGGDVVISGSIFPGLDNTTDLGSATNRFANVYTGDLHLRNDKGDWTIVEERDALIAVNNITGKKYEMMLKPIDK
jgi:hypothetical protein